jgi:2-methylcitrate dehydratase PrpD
MRWYLMQITEKLSEFLADMSYSDMNGDDVTAAKYRILDWMGCAIGGAANENSAKLIELYARAGGKEESSIVMGNLNVPCANAAFVNGVLGHTLEYDDVQKRALTHPGAIAVPVSLAEAEAWGASGKALLLGVVAGYEIMIRLGEAVNPSHYQYWHTTGT